MRRFFKLLFFTLLLAYLIQTGISQGYWSASFKPKTITQILEPQVNPAEVTAKINTYRLSHSLPVFNEDPKVCQRDSATGTLTVKQFLTQCPNCSQVSLVTVSKFVSPNELLTAFINDAVIDGNLLSPEMNLLCTLETSDDLLMFFAVFKTKTQLAKTQAPLAVTPKPKPTAVVKNFSESEIWQALAQYRQSHQRSALTLDPNICNYSRKRLQDHLELITQNLPASAYPIPDKYPLDGHSGFSEDAASGLAFEVTRRNHLAENLAFWPDAQSPIQVIEWGWDTSTEGHKETQLSNDWSAGCISSQDGFYVAIFGY